jgi:hypothetical protein
VIVWEIFGALFCPVSNVTTPISYRRVTRKFNTLTGECFRSWSAGQGPVSAILRYQQFIVSASPEKGLITLWQENGSVVSVIRELNTKPSEDIYLVAHEPSNLLVSATRNGWITAWDMTAKSRIAEHKPTSMMKIDSITLTVRTGGQTRAHFACPKTWIFVRVHHLSRWWYQIMME